MTLGRSRFRIHYYDAFSRVYDRFVAAHSRDPLGALRNLLAQRAALRGGDRVLDLCTGTGAMLPALAQRAGRAGLVVGLDFSRGMLQQARRKTAGMSGVVLVRADAECLPFRERSFDAVTCSHAFYELKGTGVDRTLKEIVRALRPDGRFLMMEHEAPEKPVLRVLFHVRLLSMGLRTAREVIGREEALFRRYFSVVERIVTQAGQSKIVRGQKSRREEPTMTQTTEVEGPELTAFVSRIQADGVPLEPRAILEAVDHPAWEATAGARDWRNYVPPSTRKAWDVLPLVARLCVFETAELAALEEDAGTSMVTGPSVA
jgi:ubiquinone/menaquinone biosynthesis C-methylase UbiE